MWNRTFLPFFTGRWWLSLLKSEDLFIFFFLSPTFDLQIDIWVHLKLVLNGIFNDYRTIFWASSTHDIRDFLELWREHFLPIPLIFVLSGSLRARVSLHGLLSLFQDRVLTHILTIAGDRWRCVTKGWLRVRGVLEDLLIVNDISWRFLNIFLSLLLLLLILTI